MSGWLNAGPRAWIAFAADNGDLKFPFRVPIQQETCEAQLIFDLKHSGCSTPSNNRALQRDLHMGMAVAAGYFGGYSSKMQDIGAAEVKRLRATLERKVSGEPAQKPAQDFQKYSRRLVKDLEAKGIIRTALEGVNLARYADKAHDILMV